MKTSRARRIARRRRRRTLRSMRRHRWQTRRHGRFDTPHGSIIIHKMPKRKKA